MTSFATRESLGDRHSSVGHHQVSPVAALRRGPTCESIERTGLVHRIGTLQPTNSTPQPRYPVTGALSFAGENGGHSNQGSTSSTHQWQGRSTSQTACAVAPEKKQCQKLPPLQKGTQSAGDVARTLAAATATSLLSPLLVPFPPCSSTQNISPPPSASFSLATDCSILQFPQLAISLLIKKPPLPCCNQFGSCLYFFISSRTPIIQDVFQHGASLPIPLLDGSCANWSPSAQLHGD